jgi:hypothetical protein
MRWPRESFEEVLVANSVTSADMTALDHIHEPAVLRYCPQVASVAGMLLLLLVLFCDMCGG